MATLEEKLDEYAVVRRGYYDLEMSDLSRFYANPTQFGGVQYWTDWQEAAGTRLGFYIQQPPWSVMAPGARFAAGLDPAFLEKNGISRHEAAYRIEEWFRAAPTTQDGRRRIKRGNRQVPTTAYVKGHNSSRADRPWVNMFMYMMLREPWAITNTRGVIAGDTLADARAAATFAGDVFEAPTDAASGRKSFRLGQLMQANGVVMPDGRPFDEADAHDATYDADATAMLDKHIETVAPEVASQMISNSRKAALIDFMRGTGTGYNHRPVFTFARSVGGEMRSGLYCLIETGTSFGNGNVAVLMNIRDYDPAELMRKLKTLSPEAIANALSWDPDGGKTLQKPLGAKPKALPPFEIVKLNEPLLVGPRALAGELGLDAGVTDATLKKRLDFIEKTPAFRQSLIKGAVAARAAASLGEDAEIEQEIYSDIGRDYDAEDAAREERNRQATASFVAAKTGKGRAAALDAFDDPTGRYAFLGAVQLGAAAKDLPAPWSDLAAAWHAEGLGSKAIQAWLDESHPARDDAPDHGDAEAMTVITDPKAKAADKAKALAALRDPLGRRQLLAKLHLAEHAPDSLTPRQRLVHTAFAEGGITDDRLRGPLRQPNEMLTIAIERRDAERMRRFRASEFEFTKPEGMSAQDWTERKTELWKQRAATIDRFEDPTGRRAFRALLYVGGHDPDLLTPQQAKLFDAFVAYRVNGPVDAPWMSAPRALKELEAIEKGPTKVRGLPSTDPYYLETMQRTHERFKADPANKEAARALRQFYRDQVAAYPLTPAKLRLLGIDPSPEPKAQKRAAPKAAPKAANEHAPA